MSVLLSCRSVRVVLLVLLLALAASDAREFRARRNGIGGGAGATDSAGDAITIPDTGNIDNDLLKAVSADKFLSLWFIFVLGGSTRNTDSPWTLFVPLNTGLPGPGTEGFLSDKEATRSLLLNHAVLGAALEPATLLQDAAAAGGIKTEGGTDLVFTQENGDSYVNGVKLTGDKISVAGGSVLVIESFLPLLSPSSPSEELADAPLEHVTSEPQAKEQTTPKEPFKPHLVKEKPTSFRVNFPRSGDTITLAKDSLPATPGNSRRAGGPTDSSSRQSRFDKFRKSERKSTVAADTAENSVKSAAFAPVGRPLFENLVTKASAQISETTLPTVTSTAVESTTLSEVFEETELSTEAPLLVLKQETTTTVAPSPTPDIFAFFGAAKSSTTEQPSQQFDEIAATTTEEITSLVAEHETETPLLAFDTFVKTTSNGKQFFSDSEIEDDSTTTSPIDSELEFEKRFEPETEFLSDSDFVPFNEFLNSQTATEKFNEAFEMLPEGAEVMPNSGDEAPKNSTSTVNFLTWLKREVKTRQQLGGKEFLHHLLESGIASELTYSKQYTALIPTDEAFYAYYPIDWGFNPFLVESFLKRTLREHLLEGDIALEDLADGTQLTTLAGTTLELRKKDGAVTVSGVSVLTESEVLSPYGRIYSLPSLLHVTDLTVKLLREMNPHLERAPLLGSPWPMSQFLSHLLQRTQRPQTTDEGSTGSAVSTAMFAEYLALSHLSHLAPSSDEDFNQLEYTALVPTDSVILAALSKEAESSSSRNTAGSGASSIEDRFLVDATARNNLVGSHILKGRHSISSLRPGTTVTTLLNDTLLVTATPGGGIAVGGSELTPPGDSIYNLGAMFIVKGPLILKQEDSNSQTEGPTVAPQRARALEVASEPRVITRTEVSVSRRVNDGAIESVPTPVAEMLAARRLR